MVVCKRVQIAGLQCPDAAAAVAVAAAAPLRLQLLPV